jgi:hypothetical protein
MMAVETLAGAPPGETRVHTVAPSQYREAVASRWTGTAGPAMGPFERPERLDAKVSRAVPRGPGASNGPWLPDLPPRR